MSNLIRYRKDIDGLRALAIISVVLFHLDKSFLASGFVGVDVFFVISGFLITKILIKEIENNSFSFTNFYIRRIRRIFPALFCMLFFSLIFAILFMGTEDMQLFFKSLRFSAAQISNFFFQEEAGYFDHKMEIMPLLHTWSLAVEEQFYLILPLILFALFKLWGRGKIFVFYSMLMLSALSLVLSEYLLKDFAKLSFFSLPSRFWELGLGAILSFFNCNKLYKIANEALALCGLVMIIASFFIINESAFPGLIALIPCVGSGLVIFSGNGRETLVSRLLSSRALVFLGLISYSLYLWHYPIISFYKYIFEVSSFGNIETIAIFLSSIAVSCLSYKYIETPFRKRKKSPEESYCKILNVKIQTPFVASFAFIAIFILISLFVKDWQRAKHMAIFDKIAPRDQASFNGRCTVNQDSILDQSLIKECSKNGEMMEVLITGDSHAVRLGHGLINWGMKNNIAVGMIGSPGMSIVNKKNNPFYDDLREFIYKEIVSDERLKTVILANRWDDYIFDKEFEKKLEKIVKYLTDHKKKVVIVGLGPIFNFNPVTCISKNESLFGQFFDVLKKRDCYKEKRSEVVRNEKFLGSLFARLQSQYGAEYFDPKVHLCDENYCYSKIAGKVLFTDYNHLGYLGSNYIAEFFNF